MDKSLIKCNSCGLLNYKENSKCKFCGSIIIPSNIAKNYLPSVNDYPVQKLKYKSKSNNAKRS